MLFIRKRKCSTPEIVGLVAHPLYTGESSPIVPNRAQSCLIVPNRAPEFFAGKRKAAPAKPERPGRKRRRRRSAQLLHRFPLLLAGGGEDGVADVLRFEGVAEGR